MTIHDIRTVADSSLNRIGAQPWVVGHVALGHARPKLLRTYMPTLPLKEAREMLQKWGEQIEKILSGAVGAQGQALEAQGLPGEVCLSELYSMPMRKTSTRPARYTRKSFFVNPKAIDQARKALGAGTDAEAVRVAVDRVVEMDKFWRFMTESRASLKPGSIEAP